MFFKFDILYFLILSNFNWIAIPIFTNKYAKFEFVQLLIANYSIICKTLNFMKLKCQKLKTLQKNFKSFSIKHPKKS